MAVAIADCTRAFDSASAAACRAVLRIIKVDRRPRFVTAATCDDREQNDQAQYCTSHVGYQLIEDANELIISD